MANERAAEDVTAGMRLCACTQCRGWVQPKPGCIYDPPIACDVAKRFDEALRPLIAELASYQSGDNKIAGRWEQAVHRVFTRWTNLNQHRTAPAERCGGALQALQQVAREMGTKLEVRHG
jgi:hypothetical protein